MRDFSEIFEIAVRRKGGADALEILLTRPLDKGQLAARKDAEWLSAMAKCIFQAGFNWQVIDNKWPAFEVAFDGFEPGLVAAFDEDKMDKLLSDSSIVRNRPKLMAVQRNAIWLVELAQTHGSAAAFFADWPDDDQVGLLSLFGKLGDRLGGATGQRVLRVMGKDSFVLSQDVVARLIAEGIVDKPPTSQRDLAAVQAAFNRWKEQSGRSLTEVSKTLAYSVGS